jgi:hypothetical protein
MEAMTPATPENESHQPINQPWIKRNVMNEKFHDVVNGIDQVSRRLPVDDYSAGAIAVLVMELRENRKAHAEQMAQIGKLIKELTWVLKLAGAGHGEA